MTTYTQQTLNKILSELNALSIKIDKLANPDNKELQANEELLANEKNRIRKNKISECLDNFDFEKVHDIMNFLNWNWFDGYDERGVPTYRVPSIYAIKVQAHDLLKQCFECLDKEDEKNLIQELDDKQYTISTGGLTATVWADNECSLYFNAVSSETGI
jgi:hypothetical protein